MIREEGGVQGDGVRKGNIVKKSQINGRFRTLGAKMGRGGGGSNLNAVI